MSPRHVSAGDVEFLRKLAAESMLVSASGSRLERGAASSTERDFHLSDESNFSIRDDVDDRQWVFGGQYLSVPANSRIDVDLEVEVIGEAGQRRIAARLEDGRGESISWSGFPISNRAAGLQLFDRRAHHGPRDLPDRDAPGRKRAESESAAGPHADPARIRRSDPPLVVHQFDVERSPDRAAAEGAVRP